jgi:hypothetical protein
MLFSKSILKLIAVIIKNKDSNSHVNYIFSNNPTLTVDGYKKHWFAEY